MTTTTAAMSEAACRAPKPPSAQRRLTGVELKKLYFRNGSAAPVRRRRELTFGPCAVVAS